MIWSGDERDGARVAHAIGLLAEDGDRELLRGIGLNGVGDVVEGAVDVDGRVTLRRDITEERAKTRVNGDFRLAVDREVSGQLADLR